MEPQYRASALVVGILVVVSIILFQRTIRRLRAELMEERRKNSDAKIALRVKNFPDRELDSVLEKRMRR